MYLDTHAALRLYEGALSSFSREAQRALARESDLRISPMAFLEIEFLREIGRIKKPAVEVVASLTLEIGLRICDFPFADVARQAMHERWTRDPFDRMIVAQARIAEAALLTRDVYIQESYSRALG
jgi:PIN domain nuclease of toxin-antitoxin system